MAKIRMTAPPAKNNTKPIRSHIPAALFFTVCATKQKLSYPLASSLLGNRLNLFRGNSMNVAATVAPEEVHICSRIASSNGRPKFQFVVTIRTTARIVIGGLHRALKTLRRVCWSCELTPSFCDRAAKGLDQWQKRANRIKRVADPRRSSFYPAVKCRSAQPAKLLYCGADAATEELLPEAEPGCVTPGRARAGKQTTAR